jgi:hypothetical protein
MWTSAPLDVGGLSHPRHRDLHYGPLEIVLALRENGVTAAPTIAKAALSTPTGASPPLDQEITMPIPRILQGKLALPVIGAPLFYRRRAGAGDRPMQGRIVGAFPALNARPKVCSRNGSCVARASLPPTEGESGEARGALCREPDRACLQRPARPR